MKKSAYIILLIVLSFTIKSQNKINSVSIAAQTWQNAILRADGKTEIDGVEAYCTKAICGNEEFVFIKFINKNEYKVVVQWVNAIFVNGVWYYSKNQSPVKIQLEPNNDEAGQCEGSEKLKVKISSILDNPKDFQHYTVSGLEIIK